LLASPTITTVDRRSLRNDRFVEHQQDCALATRKPAF
jgi:hypothetical protein